MYDIKVTETIDADAQAVWDTIAKGDGVHHWFTGVITACRVDGTDRYCTMADGSDLEERILDVDQENRRFTYAIDKHPLPATDVVSTIIVGATDSGAEVTWACSYEADTAAAQQVGEMLMGIYKQGIEGLAQHHARAA